MFEETAMWTANEQKKHHTDFNEKSHLGFVDDSCGLNRKALFKILYVLPIILLYKCKEILLDIIMSLDYKKYWAWEWMHTHSCNPSMLFS